MREPRREVDRKFFRFGCGLIAAVALALVVLTLLRNSGLGRERRRLAADAAAGQRVSAARVDRSPSERELVLTGEALAYTTAILYAKVSGYLASIAVDKGDLVSKGQHLATIESPETDQSYNAAVANALNLDKVAARYRVLLRKTLVSPQEAQQGFANARVADAQVRQTKALKDYENITAPFDGKITARFVDPGALIPAATGAQTGATPVVTVSEVDRLRVYVYVDQRDAGAIRPDLKAQVWLAERPGLRWPASVARLAGALDPNTRMLLTEIDLDNRKSLIVPGSLVRVSLTIRTPAYLQIPAAALLVRDNKMLAGVITDKQTVEFRPIQVVENDGKTMRVRGELREGELVALDLGSNVVSGTKVQAQESEAMRAPGASPSHDERKSAYEKH